RLNHIEIYANRRARIRVCKGDSGDIGPGVVKLGGPSVPAIGGSDNCRSPCGDIRATGHSSIRINKRDAEQDNPGSLISACLNTPSCSSIGCSQNCPAFAHGSSVVRIDKGNGVQRISLRKGFLPNPIETGARSRYFIAARSYLSRFMRKRVCPNAPSPPTDGHGEKDRCGNARKESNKSDDSEIKKSELRTALCFHRCLPERTLFWNAGLFLGLNALRLCWCTAKNRQVSYKENS